MLLRIAVISSTVALAACGPTVPFDAGGTTSGADDDDDDDGDDRPPDPSMPGTTMPGTATSPTTNPTSMTTMSDDGPNTTNGEGEEGPDSVSFIDGGDFGGGGGIECDVWNHDCPDGEKCMPWANDGGTAWNATRCVAIDREPGSPPDPCSVEGSGFSGIDDCALRSMCWGVDDTTNLGTCYAQCEGNEVNSICADGRICFIGYDGTMTLCVTACDPLAPVCAAHEACVIDASSDVARCIPTLLVTGNAYAEPCDSAVFECGTGLVCVHPDHVPSCGDTCCTVACDLMAPLECPDVASGQTCLPLYSDGQAPPGFETLGFCGMPA